jgi:mRNA-degrading endonuclease HigB of HigAB toxin-antitoxin module
MKRLALLLLLVFFSAVIVTCGGGGGSSPQVIQKSWNHPASISDHFSSNTQQFPDSQVAMNDNGDAIVVWQENDGSNWRVYKSEYRSGVWTYPTSTADALNLNGGVASDPRVAMDNGGNAIVVWVQTDGSTDQIYKSEYRNGVWTHPTSTSDHISPTGQNAQQPNVAMDNKGNAIIVWSQNDGTTASTYYQIFKGEFRNNAWLHPVALSGNISPDSQDATSPKVAMDDNGNAIIAWQQSDGANQQIFKSEYRNSTWTHPTSLSDNISPDGQPMDEPQVAMDNRGHAMIVWEGLNVPRAIFKSEYGNNLWTHPTSTSDHIDSFGLGVYECRLAMDNNGNAIIVSRQAVYAPPYPDYIYKSEYRNGLWTHPTSTSGHISPSSALVNPADQKTEIPAVAMDDNGNAIIVWSQLDGAEWQTFKSEYRNGAWTHPTSLADNISPDGMEVLDTHIAMGNSGNAIIVWDQDAGGGIFQVFKSEYR